MSNRCPHGVRRDNFGCDECFESIPIGDEARETNRSLEFESYEFENMYKAEHVKSQKLVGDLNSIGELALTILQAAEHYGHKEIKLDAELIIKFIDKALSK